MEEKETKPIIAPKQMPSIGDLIRETWQTLKSSWLHLTIFSFISMVIGFAVFVVFALVAVLLAIPFGIWEYVAKRFTPPPQGVGVPHVLPQLDPMVFVGLGVIYLLFFLVMIVLSGMFQIGYLLIANAKGDKIEYGAILKKSFALVMPYFWVSSLAGLLAMGGVFIFIIPGIIISIFLMFATYEVVFAGKSSMNALRGSVSIVKQNFWDIVGRGVVLILLGIAIQIPRIVLQVLPAAFSGNNNSASVIMAGVLNMIITLVYIVVSILWGWFSLVYMLHLYTHAKAASKEESGSLMWIVIVAIVGWIIGIITMIFVSSAFYSFVSSGALEKIFNASTKKSASLGIPVKQSVNQTKANEYIKAGQVKLEAANTLAQKTPLTNQDKITIQAVVQSALEDFQKATQVNPESYEAWLYHGDAYRRLIGFADNAETFAISSFEKSIELNPNDVYAYYALGGIYYNMNDYENSVKNFKKLVELDPKNANGYYNLGYAYMKSGNKVQARIAFQKVIDLLPTDAPDRVKAEEALQSL